MGRHHGTRATWVATFIGAALGVAGITVPPQQAEDWNGDLSCNISGVSSKCSTKRASYDVPVSYFGVVPGREVSGYGVNPQGVY